MSETAAQELARRTRVLATLPYIETALLAGDERLPSMVAKAIEMFHDDGLYESETIVYSASGRVKRRVVEMKPRVSEKGKLIILNTLARLVGFKEEVLASKGLKAVPKKVEQHLHVKLNVTPEEVRSLPLPELLKRLRPGSAAVRVE